MNELGQQIRDVIAKRLGVEISKVTDDAKFVEDLGADSLEIVELLMELEDRFNIEIPESVSDKLFTVRDAIEFISTNKN